ncbi:MAG TPA: LysR family transcriptional regulator [Polyangiaceae bacterium]|nr:LysR family transcriptional regulator [Polyangiaceae bacterium]
MDKLRAMQTFATIVDAGSLTAAARATQSSLPAVVRLLAALEAELGSRLLQRTTRRIALTDAGRRYLERCRQVLALVHEAEAELRAEQTQPRGQLRVTAPVLFGTRHVAPGITAFIQRYPEVSVDVVLLDRVVNLVEEGIDVGVRIGPLDDSSLIARPVASMRRLTVAAPSYLARHGTPSHPKELAAHDCVRVTHGRDSVWSYQAEGRPLRVSVHGRLGLNQTLAAVQACAAGLGIGSFAAYQVAPELASGALRLLLERFEPAPAPVHIVYSEARLVPARTRAFVDFMREHLDNERSAWEPPATRSRPRKVRNDPKPG